MVHISGNPTNSAPPVAAANPAPSTAAAPVTLIPPPTTTVLPAANIVLGPPIEVEEKPKSTLPALARPADLPSFVVQQEGGIDGLMNPGQTALQLPLLCVAQPLTKAVGDKQMEAGDLFLHDQNDRAIGKAGQAYLIQPIFQFIEWVEWAPREAKLGILNRSKDPKGDLARRWAMKWAARDTAKQVYDPKRDAREQSELVETYVFFAFMNGNYSDPIAIPLSKTKHKKARKLISLIHRRGQGVPMYAGKYEIKTVLETNPAGQRYWNFDFAPAGWVNEEEYAIAQRACAEIKTQYQTSMLQYEGSVDAADDVRVAGADSKEF